MLSSSGFAETDVCMNKIVSKKQAVKPNMRFMQKPPVCVTLVIVTQFLSVGC